MRRRYTVPGALTQAVAKYEYNSALRKRQVLDTANTAFERKYQNALTNPYHVQQATGVYNVGIIERGLGDGEDDSSDSETSWTDVVKTFVGEVGKGVGGWISGQNPYINKPPTVAPQAPPTPGWVAPAVIGGGILFGGLLIYAVTRK